MPSLAVGKGYIVFCLYLSKSGLVHKNTFTQVCVTGDNLMLRRERLLLLPCAFYWFVEMWIFFVQSWHILLWRLNPSLIFNTHLSWEAKSLSSYRASCPLYSSVPPLLSSILSLCWEILKVMIITKASMGRVHRVLMMMASISVHVLRVLRMCWVIDELCTVLCNQ